MVTFIDEWRRKFPSCMVVKRLKQILEFLENVASKPEIRILLWTSMHGWRFNLQITKGVMLDDCGEFSLTWSCGSRQRDTTSSGWKFRCSCKFTNRKGTLTNGTDAVMFDLRAAEFVKKGKANVPDYHPPGQYWLLYNHEGMFYDGFPGDTFNLTATYRRDADIYLPYGKCEPRKEGKYVLPPDFLKKKNGLVVRHVSHCTDRSLRMTFTKQLQKYIEVDVFGGCGNKTLPKDNRIFVGHNLSDVETANINKYKFYYLVKIHIVKII